MIRGLLSRYRPRYIRSLAYMLQATEYTLTDYLAWYVRTEDFSRVESRGHLHKTPKAHLVLSVIWVCAGALVGISIWYAIQFEDPGTDLFVLILCLLLVPYALGFLITLPLLIIRYAVQRPIESVIIRRARQKLLTHPGYRIAVAGSFGKTSMREILRVTLSESKSVAAPPKSYNTLLGLSKFVMGLNGSEEVLVFELGEYYRGDIKRLSKLVRPSLGIITGVNEAHLSKFKRLGQTTATIFELADALSDGPVYVNGSSSLAKKAARDGHILYTSDGAGEWRVSKIKTGLDGTSFTLSSKHGVINVKSHLLGVHQVGPLSAAADIATRLGLTPNEIEKGLAKIHPFDHRLEPKTDASGVTTLDDSYNGNPDGAAAVIAFLGSLTDHRRIYVTPGLVEMGPRAEIVHEKIGHELAESDIDVVILIQNSVTPYIARGLEKSHFKGQVLWYETGPDALAALTSLTKHGDVVLLQNDWPDQYA
jgi:UDP-N-acetylmuramoyl-tripeptide--D-alanyl-D-alanine ligase